MQKVYSAGASTSVCPRGGYVWLTQNETRYVVKVNCKTWSCVHCRNRNHESLRMRMAVGLSILGPSWFITVTLRYAGADTLKDASFVGRAWQRLIYRLNKNPGYEKMAWFKITELTKEKQPHLHLLVGGLPGGKTKKIMHREWVRAWRKATGDSFIVDVRPIRSYLGIAHYLDGYVTKNIHKREDLERIGFKRRWSCSNNWPRGEVRLLGSRLGWTTSHYSKLDDTDIAMAGRLLEMRKGDPLLDISARPEALEAVTVITRSRNLRKAERKMRHVNTGIRPQGDPQGHRSEFGPSGDRFNDPV